MKKNIFKMFVVFALILSCSLALVACGGSADSKKEEELAGKYELIKVEYKPSGQEEYQEYTKEEYDAIPAEYKAGIPNFFGEYEVKLDDHKVYLEGEAVATWKVADGKLVVEAIEDEEEPEEDMTFSAELVDNCIVISATMESGAARITLTKKA
ncbi:MAG: hypothetical protein IK070_00120 [Clostridia bacterium]|nr:hypothetical protein [Clostridia bacterium]